MSIKIVLDAGHGGYDNGASYGERKEKEEVLELTKAVGVILEKAGYDVEYTRTTDVYQSPFEKAQIANKAGADYFVSFHRNASEDPNQYKGIQTLVYEETGIVKTLGDNVNRQLEQVGFKNIGIEERPGLVVLKRTKMPAILIEAGFINTEVDNELFDEKFNEIAQAIAEGIEESIPLEKENETEPYAVQVGLFRYYSNAAYLEDELQEQGFLAQIKYIDPYYAVQVGPAKNLEDAAALQMQLRRLGYETLVVKGSSRTSTK